MAAWRVTLENLHDGKRSGFTNPGKRTAFLEEKTNNFDKEEVTNEE